MDIENMVAEQLASAEAPKVETTAEAQVETKAEEPQPTEPPAPAEKKPEDFSNKARNALSYRDKKIGKLQAQNEALNRELEQLRQRAGSQPAEPKGPPKETEYQNYADYLEAKQEYLLTQKLAERDKQQLEAQAQKVKEAETLQEQEWVQERETVVAEKAEQFKTEHPEAFSVIQENADIIDDFSPQLQRLFLEADNAPLAFYNLAKEGLLEKLPNMSLHQAAMLIGRAQATAIAKPQTKAPAPLPAARGSVAGDKQLHEMTPDELMKWVKS